MKRVLALTLWLVASGSIHTLPNLVYASTGDLDPFFGVNGKASTHIVGTDTDEGNAVALQPDGKIIVAGQTFSAATSLYHLALVRYNSDGTLDQTFGSAGTVIGNFPNRTERALAVVLQSDGKIIVAGQTKLTSNANSGDFLLARYNSNGTLDNSFGSGGMVATDFNGTNDEARAIVVQANGRILVAGSGGTSNSFALARYNSTGALDTFFSGSGKATLTFGGYNGGASALALQTDGKIVVAGTGSFGSLPDFAVARLTEDGNPDFSFGFFSVVTSDFSGDGTSSSSDSAQALAIQSDGKIILAGRGHNTFALARYNTNGSADTTFGNTGKVVGLPLSDNSSGGATGLAIQADGRIVAGGSVLNVSGNSTSDFALARYNTNGGLDQSFGTNGVTIADISGNTLDDFANALQLQPDGKVILAGTVVKDASNQQRDFAVARFQGGSSNQNCLFTITQFARTFQQSGGTGSVTVTTSGGCNWAAQSNATWLTITSGASGSGNGTVSYTVAANSSTSSRSGTMNIAGQTFTVTQDGATSASPTVQFSASTYSVNEDGNSAAITVTRTGNTSGAVAVNYATSDTAGLTNCNVTGTGIASSRCDYATSIGTLRFAIGESSKTISIPIVDDNFTEGAESFTITLSSPVGASLGSIQAATVTITDNANTAGNPIDQTPFFVRQHYIDFLGREPDPAGFQGWQNTLNNCAPGDKTCDRIEVSSGFFRSTEFQERGYFVYRFYSVSLGRKPDYTEFMPDLAKVSGFLTDAEKEANKVAFIDEFMSRSAFKNRYDSTIGNPTSYVDALLNTAGLQNHPSRAGWIDGLNKGTLTRARVLRELAESAEAYSKFYNEAFVVMQYFGYLRRDPDIFYLDWIKSMNQNGDYRVMIDGFMNSTEYRQRFGP